MSPVRCIVALALLLLAVPVPARPQDAAGGMSLPAPEEASTSGVPEAEIAAPPADESDEEEVAGEEAERADAKGDPFFPSLDFYFPEGEMDLRLHRLIRNAFVEGQVRYNFVDGDIDSFLRYRYYGYGTIYQISVFDSIQFESVEELSNDFTRTRGGLLLLTWPHSYVSRTFLTGEVDRYTSNREEFRFSTNRTNMFIRVGHQVGTPNDRRSNAVVGERRALTEQVFTAFQKIGPRAFGATGALTYAFDFLDGDFRYVKAEFELVKRFEVSARTFVIGRLHGGSFLDKDLVRDDAELPMTDRFSIPRPEFFQLDGRDNLKGIDERLRGTEELHTTWEYFVPWFVDQRRRALKLDWTNWYWVLYSGIGTIGFDRDVLTDTDGYIPDVGFGFEASVERRNYTFFLAAVVAHALDETGGLEAKISVKTFH